MKSKQKLDAHEEEQLYTLTKERLQSFNPSESISKEKLLQLDSISQSEIDNIDDVDFE